MSNLSAFLNPITTKVEKEIIVSDRFIERDQAGEPVLDSKGGTILKPFRIRAMTQEENDAIVRKSTKVRKVNGQPQEYLDNVELTRRIVVAATVEPDFSSTELCQAFGVMDPLLVPVKMLLSGEYDALAKAILSLSGFDADPAAEAKN